MNELIETVNKTTWGEGPWQTEPDSMAWAHAGLPCVLNRHPTLGQLCGYVGVSKGHPFWKIHYRGCYKGCRKAPPRYVSRKAIGKAKRQGDRKNIEFLENMRRFYKSKFLRRHGSPSYVCRWDSKHSPESNLEAHGGITFADFTRPNIHPGQDQNIWWFGFDCAHSGDLSPGMNRFDATFIGDHYRDAPYVIAQTNSLAEQLAALSKETP